MKNSLMQGSHTRFKIIADGPLEITGHFRLINAGGETLDKEGPVFLCRCGGSANKPYCDGTHRRNGFSG